MENNTLCNRHSLGVNNHTKMYVTYTRIYGWSDYGGESSYQPGYRLENMMWMTLLVYDYIIPGENNMGTDFEVTMNEYLPLRDVVFNTLRQAILRGELKPGERLMEIQLANKLGVSRTPIREAIRKLELEGLVLMIPRKGAEVAEITEKNMRDVLEVRKALEELAVQLACEKITDEEIEEMKKAAEEFKMILKSKDITEIAEADVRFHDIIYMATDNQKLILLLNNLREQMYRYRVEYLKREEAYPQLIAEHAAIIEYISKGEKKAATDVMCKHIDNQVTTVIDVIRTKQN